MYVEMDIYIDIWHPRHWASDIGVTHEINQTNFIRKRNIDCPNNMAGLCVVSLGCILPKPRFQMLLNVKPMCISFFLYCPWPLKGTQRLNSLWHSLLYTVITKYTVYKMCIGSKFKIFELSAVLRNLGTSCYGFSSSLMDLPNICQHGVSCAKKTNFYWNITYLKYLKFGQVLENLPCIFVAYSPKYMVIAVTGFPLRVMHCLWYGWFGEALGTALTRRMSSVGCLNSVDFTFIIDVWGNKVLCTVLPPW